MSLRELYYPDKLYDGKEIGNLPDIIFIINNWRCIIKETNLEEPLFKEEPYSSRHTESHRLEGIFLAHGPDIRDSEDEIENMHIYDITPTILHMHDIGLPPNLDGRVLKEIFTKESPIREREPKYRRIDPSTARKI